MRGAVLYRQRGVRFEERGMPTAAMTHIGIQEQLDGKAVDVIDRSATTKTACDLRYGMTL